jgi:glycosyltransferase involved in cell wall biosynthesis
MSLTIEAVIPTYDRPGRAEALAKALERQCRGGDGVLVVAQGRRRPAGLPAGARLMALERPNLPAARNAALAASAADIVLFIDDDCSPAADLLEAHRSCYGDNAISGVAGFVDDPLFERSRPRPSFIDLTTGECVQNFSAPQSRRTASVMGANMSFRRAALLAAGGFDERYTHNALWEEVDLSLRLLAAGGALWYCAEAKVAHARDDRGGCRSHTGRRYLYHRFANTAYFAARFAEPRHYGSWLTFWKYRLEYLSRKQPPAADGRVSHDAAAVLCGACGAAAGIARFLLARLLGGNGIGRVDRGALAKALAALESGAGP